jgi:SAM-dependent methyltransferase
MAIQLDEFKTRQRDTWSAGDYGQLTERIAEVGELVARRAEIAPGMRVLDVACGSGNATLPSARAGAQVTGLDLTAKLLEQGRAKAEAEGLDIEWVEGDAEALPFEDDSFDRVVSTFGHMFGPRHELVATEMLRVCRSGGRIVTATWTPEGVAGRMFAASAPFLPPPPDYASPPILWGKEDYVRERFGAAATSFDFDRQINWQVDRSVEAFADLFMNTFPPMVTARKLLGERFGELEEQIVSIWRDANEATDGTMRMPQEYLVSVVRL